MKSCTWPRACSRRRSTGSATCRLKRWRIPPGRCRAGPGSGLTDCQRLLLLSEEPTRSLPEGLGEALLAKARDGVLLAALGAGIYPLAQLGLLDGHRVALHWRWQDGFTERFPQVAATQHLFVWDAQRLTACGGMALLDMLLAMLAQARGAELAGAIAEELVFERIRESGESQRVPLRNRLGASHPKLTQAVLLMETHIEEPLTTDEDRPAGVGVAASAGAHLQAVPATGCRTSTTWNCA